VDGSDGPRSVETEPFAGQRGRLGQAGRVLVVDDPRLDRHVPPGHHPERPERLTAAREAIAKSADAGVQFERVKPRSATDDELARVHDRRFIESLTKLRGKTAYLDPDTYIAAESVEIARLAAGSLVAMVDAMIDGPIPKGVALLRPPGHHARPARAMGFCLLNNVAVAAAAARARGLGRIAIVDWDVHHGNGTQEIFWTDPQVLYISTHQHPFYPGTGDAEEVGLAGGRGYTVNVPLAAGSGDVEYAAAFGRIVLPVLEAYAPDLLLVSAGFDASARDPLAQMELSPNAFGWMARELARVTAGSTKGRMGLVLEGGYDLVALEAGLRSAVVGMLSGRAEDIAGEPEDEAGISRAATSAKRTWHNVD
jgi:acetoin utilization deacetylase AcuC-like enzyme